VGLSPALNPRVLEEAGRGQAAARADLFNKSLVGISTPAGTPGEALKLAAGLVALLGAEPYFADLAEVDGIMASAHLLPGLAAAMLAETVLRQPGWGDIRKLAGKHFMASMNLLELEEPQALAELAVHNQADALRVLDDYIAALQSLREKVQAGDTPVLRAQMEQLVKDLEAWRHDRHQGNWKTVEFGRAELPKAGDILKQQVGGLDKLFRRGKKKPDGG
jgi:prephenate dehydrogenase